MDSFEKISKAYGIPYCRGDGMGQVEECLTLLQSHGPAIIEVNLGDTTYIYPKLAVGKDSQDQEPEICRRLYDGIIGL